MKKTIIAALASLMLAGAISAVSGETPSTANGTVMIVGDGASPLPASRSFESPRDERSNHQN
jgi:hypothetical protein